MVIQIKNRVLSLLEMLIGVLFLVITAVTAAQVFCRYVLNFSIMWSHELTIMLLIWAVWLSVPIGINKGSHLAVTWLTDNVSPGLRRGSVWIQWGLSLFFFGLTFSLTFPVINAFRGMYLLTLPVPTNIRYVAATVGCLFSLLVLTAQLFEEKRSG